MRTSGSRYSDKLVPSFFLILRVQACSTQSALREGPTLQDITPGYINEPRLDVIKARSGAEFVDWLCQLTGIVPQEPFDGLKQYKIGQPRLVYWDADLERMRPTNFFINSQPVLCASPVTPTPFGRPSKSLRPQKSRSHKARHPVPNALVPYVSSQSPNRLTSPQVGSIEASVTPQVNDPQSLNCLTLPQVESIEASVTHPVDNPPSTYHLTSPQVNSSSTNQVTSSHRQPGYPKKGLFEECLHPCARDKSWPHYRAYQAHNRSYHPTAKGRHQAPQIFLQCIYPGCTSSDQVYKNLEAIRIHQV